MQILLNSVITAAVYALVGVSFALLFSARRFFDFSHAATLTVGAYATFAYHQAMHLPFPVAAAAAVFTSSILGWLLHRFVFVPLDTNGAPPLSLLLASLGLYVVIQNLISLGFGDRILSIRQTTVLEGYHFIGARITRVQTTTILCSVLQLAIVWVVLRWTRLGAAFRAIASDRSLATLVGLPVNRVSTAAIAVGAGLSGAAGILIALDIDVTPTMGMLPFMMGVVTVVLGGIRSVPGIALGALMLGCLQNLAAWFIGSNWQNTVAFVILVLFLLARPEGFLGTAARERKV